jgi:uncharacterized membrane protein
MKNKINKIILYVLIFGYIFYFCLISAIKFYAYSFYDFDLAVHALSIWNIVHGSIFNSILGIPFLGNHLNLILFLLAPVYFIFPHPFTLLFIQTLFLGLGAVPIYLLAKRVLDEKWALVLVFAYLFYPALAYANLFEFHPPALATFFILFAVYFYELGHFYRFMLFSLLAMFCQENIPLAIVMLGFLSILRRKGLKWIIVPILLGLVYFILALLLMGNFNNNTVQFISLYKWMGSSVSNMFVNLLKNPVFFIKVLFRKECLLYLVQIFLPVMFIPLFSPLLLLPALPFFFQHMFSARSFDIRIYYHYTAEIIPFIFMSLIYGVKFLIQHKLVLNQRLFKIAFLCLILSVNFMYGPHFVIFNSVWTHYKSDYLDKFKDILVNKIPKNAAVVTTFEFLPHLAQRQSLYSFHHVYRGFHTLSNKPYVLPIHTEYALLDFNDRLTFQGFYIPGGYKNIQNFLLNGSWQVIDFMESLVLFKKHADISYIICKKLNKLENNPARIIGIDIDNALTFLGFDINKNTDKNILDLTLYYRSINYTPRVITIVIDILSKDGRQLARLIHPICYGIFPTSSWQKDSVYMDRLRLEVPSVYLDNHWHLKAYFFDSLEDQLLKTVDEE